MVVTALAQLREQVSGWKQQGLHVALVPTMGNLHAGHLTLVDVATRRCDRVVVSLFVNPTQFGPSEDYASYPRTLEADLEALIDRGVDLVFTPSVATMYPEGVVGGTRVQVPALEGMLCARDRPGHFTGVATVVTRLFHMVTPDLAVFGRKDYQQLLVIEHLVRDLSLPIEVHGVPTVRDARGLALSSRNGYLSASERETAAGLSATLQWLAGRLRAGEAGFHRLEEEGALALERSGLPPEYLEIRRSGDLAPATPADRSVVVLAAVRIGRARLIDNIEVDRPVAAPQSGD